MCPRLLAMVAPSSSCLTEMRSQYKNGKDTKSILDVRISDESRRHEAKDKDLTRVEAVSRRNRLGNAGKKVDRSHPQEHWGPTRRPFQPDSPQSSGADIMSPDNEDERA